MNTTVQSAQLSSEIISQIEALDKERSARQALEILQATRQWHALPNAFASEFGLLIAVAYLHDLGHSPQSERERKIFIREVEQRLAELPNLWLSQELSAKAAPENATDEPKNLAEFWADFIGSVEGSGANNSAETAEKFGDYIRSKSTEQNL